MEQHENAIIEMKNQIVRIEHHLQLLKQAQIVSDGANTAVNIKLEQILNAVTDNPFNANAGIISRLKSLEEQSNKHDIYFKLVMIIIGGSGIIALAVKYIIGV